MDDAHIMYNLCYTQIGIHPGGFAVAHPQIDKKDPLRFFVTKDKEIIINPEITNHTKVAVDRLEGCLSFPMNNPITVKRFNKIEATFQTIKPDDLNKKMILSDKIKISLNGVEAQIFQHEIDHFEGKYIFKTKK
mgnify:FL=1